MASLVHIFVLSFIQRHIITCKLHDYKLLLEWKPRFAVALVVRGLLIVTSHTTRDAPDCRTNHSSADRFVVNLYIHEYNRVNEIFLKVLGTWVAITASLRKWSIEWKSKAYIYFDWNGTVKILSFTVYVNQICAQQAPRNNIFTPLRHQVFSWRRCMNVSIIIAFKLEKPFCHVLKIPCIHRSSDAQPRRNDKHLFSVQWRACDWPMCLLLVQVMWKVTLGTP